MTLYNNDGVKRDGNQAGRRHDAGNRMHESRAKALDSSAKPNVALPNGRAFRNLSGLGCLRRNAVRSSQEATASLRPRPTPSSS